MPSMHCASVICMLRFAGGNSSAALASVVASPARHKYCEEVSL